MTSLPSIRIDPKVLLKPILNPKSAARLRMQHLSQVPFFRHISRIVISATALATICAPSVKLFASPASDADALLAKMNLDEKIGQMVQVDMLALKDKAD